MVDLHMTIYGPWKCAPCKKEYLTEEALHQHVREKHRNQPETRRNKDDEDQQEDTQ